MNRIQKIIQKICDGIEIAVAAVVIVALALSFVSYLPQVRILLENTGDTEPFLIFLEQIFNVVVGIEFIKLLFRPNTDNTFEVLIFLVARHMIVGKNNALDMFLSIVGIAILCLVRQLIHTKFAKE